VVQAIEYPLKAIQMKRFRTLRVRFALWTTVMMLIVLILFGTFVYISMWQGLSIAIDDSIEFSTSQAMAAVNIENGKVNFSDSLPESSTADLREKGFTVRILSTNGDLLQSVGPYRDLIIDHTSIQYASNKISGFSTINLNDSESIRVYTAPIIENQNIVGIIQVMQSLATLHETLDRLSLMILISVPLLLMITALSGYFLAARALSPIDQITRTAQRISTEDLSARLNLHGNDDEIGRLANTFDSMISRLEKGFNREHQFTSDASHELRTPLAAMQAILSVTRGKPRSPEDYEKAMDDLLEETSRLRALTEDLLYIARGDSRPITSYEKVDLSNLLIDVSESLRPLAESKGLLLKQNIQGGLYLFGNSDALIRAFVNLLDNAIKYTEYGEIVTEAKKNDKNSIEISISDTGRGIDQENLTHIFDRFYRVDESRTTQGFGLGLSIVQEIVKAHKGTITVTSQIRKGTTFHINFAGVDEDK
jgi:heavy metal sensor kinase